MQSFSASVIFIFFFFSFHISFLLDVLHTCLTRVWTAFRYKDCELIYDKYCIHRVDVFSYTKLISSPVFFSPSKCVNFSAFVHVFFFSNLRISVYFHFDVILYACSYFWWGISSHPSSISMYQDAFCTFVSSWCLRHAEYEMHAKDSNGTIMYNCMIINVILIPYT